ncbi:MAG: hypothetical protein ABSA11_09465 [Candidatus Bathyarchaeia archaeon]|jgi:hypothetical protein
METLVSQINESLVKKIGEFRKFNEYFGVCNFNVENTDQIYELVNDSIEGTGQEVIYRISPPRMLTQESVKMQKKYAIRNWEESYKDERMQKYIIHNISNKWSLEEILKIIDLLSRSREVEWTLEEFDQGKKAIESLNGHGVNADTILTSFVNPDLKTMDEYMIFPKYGPEIKKEKGITFMGTLKGLDVYGVPQMEKNQFLIYEKQNVGVNISPLRTYLESTELLAISQTLNAWSIKRNGCISVKIKPPTLPQLNTP